MPIKTSVRYETILNAGAMNEMTKERYPEAIIKGTSGTAARFAINAVKGNLPKEKHSVIIVKTWADNVTARMFARNPL